MNTVLWALVLVSLQLGPTNPIASTKGIYSTVADCFRGMEYFREDYILERQQLVCIPTIVKEI